MSIKTKLQNIKIEDLPTGAAAEMPEDLNERRHLLRNLVRFAYDFQKLRVATGLRVCALFKLRLGIKPGQKEDRAVQEKQEKKILEIVRKEYKTITEGAADQLPKLKDFRPTRLIHHYAELRLIHTWLNLWKLEKKAMADLEPVVVGFPLARDFLLPIPGIGPVLAAFIIGSSIQIDKARHVSSLWKYLGLDVLEVKGVKVGRGSAEGHLVERTIIDREGKEKKVMQLSHNRALKSKLVSTLAGSFLKVDSTKHFCKYAAVYREYKHRIENSSNPRWQKASVGHRNRAALRYSVKIFVADLWVFWRRLEGLPVSEPYAVAKLGHPPHGSQA